MPSNTINARNPDFKHHNQTPYLCQTPTPVSNTIWFQTPFKVGDQTPLCQTPFARARGADGHGGRPQPPTVGSCLADRVSAKECRPKAPSFPGLPDCLNAPLGSPQASEADRCGQCRRRAFLALCELLSASLSLRNFFDSARFFGCDLFAGMVLSHQETHNDKLPGRAGEPGEGNPVKARDWWSQHAAARASGEKRYPAACRYIGRAL